MLSQPHVRGSSTTQCIFEMADPPNTGQVIQSAMEICNQPAATALPLPVMSDNPADVQQSQLPTQDLQYAQQQGPQQQQEPQLLHHQHLQFQQQLAQQQQLQLLQLQQRQHQQFLQQQHQQHELQQVSQHLSYSCDPSSILPSGDTAAQQQQESGPHSKRLCVDSPSVTDCEMSQVPVSHASSTDGTGQANTERTPVQTSASPATVTRPSINNRYSRTDAGPYIVFVESLDKNVGKLHPMSVGKLLYSYSSHLKHDIVDISSSGKNRVKIELKTAAAANNLLNVPAFKDHKFDVYIPNFLLHTYGIIHDVETSLTDKEIIDAMESVYPVTSIKRYTKKHPSNPELTVPIPVCMVVFRSQTLPSHVAILGARCPVVPYVAPVIQCTNCWRFHHRANQCRSHTRCSRCGGQHQADSCPATIPTCLNCSGQHPVTERSCPIFLHQQELQRARAYATSGRALSGPHPTYSAAVRKPPSPQSSADFPPLPPRHLQQPQVAVQERSTGPPMPPLAPQLRSPPKEDRYQRNDVPIADRAGVSSVMSGTGKKQTSRPVWRQGFSDVSHEYSISQHLPQAPLPPNPYPPQYGQQAVPPRNNSEYIVEKIIWFILHLIEDAKTMPPGTLQIQPIRQLLTTLLTSNNNGGI